jgi:hypothetical protein
VVTSETGGDLGDGVLDRGTVVEAFDEERVVLEDRGNVVGAVLVAHVLVVHGGGTAAGSIFLGVVHALVRLGWLSLEVFVGCGHGSPLPPRGGICYVAEILMVAD